MSKTKKKAVPMGKITPITASMPTPSQQPRSNKQEISLCLVMIVKDEEDTMEKCLKSVAPYISYWVIVDTGSKDKTIEVIHKTMNELGIPGELPWRSGARIAGPPTESRRTAYRHRPGHRLGRA